jgi:hypothetical protein
MDTWLTQLVLQPLAQYKNVYKQNSKKQLRARVSTELSTHELGAHHHQ